MFRQREENERLPSSLQLLAYMASNGSATTGIYPRVFHFIGMILNMRRYSLAHSGFVPFGFARRSAIVLLSMALNPGNETTRELESRRRCF